MIPTHHVRKRSHGPDPGLLDGLLESGEGRRLSLNLWTKVMRRGIGPNIGGGRGLVVVSGNSETERLLLLIICRFLVGRLGGPQVVYREGREGWSRGARW